MSLRNNEDRFGSSHGADPPAPIISEDQQSNIHFTMPTELVDLPSGGKFYPENHPLHNAETVEIRHMTARDEDILVNKSFLKKGIVLDRLLESVIIDKNISIKSLLVGDKSAILVAVRITGYGSEYNTKVACPSCGDVNDHSFDLMEATTITGMENSGVDYEQTNNGTFVIKAPRTEALIEIKPLTGGDEDRLSKTNQMRLKNKLPELGMTDQMISYIVSINGAGEAGFLNSFIEEMPAMDARSIRSSYKKIMPNIDLSQQFQCNSCDYEQEMEVPFTSEFFWPE